MPNSVQKCSGPFSLTLSHLPIGTCETTINTSAIGGPVEWATACAKTRSLVRRGLDGIGVCGRGRPWQRAAPSPCFPR
jgi:hypothetical protein